MQIDIVETDKEQRQFCLGLLNKVEKRIRSVVSHEDDVKRLIILVIHDLFTPVLARSGGQYCRPLGNGISENVFVSRLADEASQEMKSFSRNAEESRCLLWRFVEMLAGQMRMNSWSAYLESGGQPDAA